ncbi:hypothetical protein [Portibacter lacus]|uniref:Viral A-type inclusion protein n=1 Tax=Portibacter lacus TaxID=1099794 RepID=A0AA37SPZ9_9BACT|nr:hypothetical protein [Portibacter lacus]GLR17407.1 hypothetical protein GCM10007940_20220 [Portibacter lacus]
MKYFIALLVLVYACAPKSPSLEAQRAQVMKVHDDSMAEMGKIRSYVKKLEEKAKSSSDSTEILNIISELESAEEGMMLWMQDYKEPAEDKLESFYTSEKIKIQKVADAIYKSIENAQKHIDN